MKRLEVLFAFVLLAQATHGAWLESGHPRARARPPAVESDPRAVKYLVVSHENWYANPELESLMQWHTRRGVMTRLIHEAGWTAQEIKDSIYAEFTRHDPAALRWVLLVGEYAEIPMAAMGGVQYGDYWYSDLLPQGTPDNYPEIGLARLSPSSATDLENQITKILTYERNPPATGDWLTRTVLLASDSTTGTLMRSIYSQSRSFWRSDFDTLMWWRQSGNESIAAAINQGRGVIAYKGHGDWDQWYSPTAGLWTVSDVNSLTNGDLTPVVFNIAPSCGDITQAECLSEAWLRKYPGGAVASFAATQASYTYPDNGMCSTAVACLCDTGRISVPGLRDYLLPAFDIGGIQGNVDAYVAKYWPGSPYPDNIYMYLMLGDPAMEVWSGGQPVAPAVTCDSIVPLGPYPFTVSVQASGRAVSNALVCAWKDSEFYSAGYTADEGSVTLQINARTPGTFSVMVSSGHCATEPHLPILPFTGTARARRLAYDIGVTSLIPPSETVPVGTMLLPSCTLYNYGMSTATYDVHYRFQGILDDRFMVSSHAPGTSAGVQIIPIPLSVPGMYIQMCSLEVADSNPTNDWKKDTIWVMPTAIGECPSCALQPGFMVLPNPFRDLVTLSLQLAANTPRSEVRIYDAGGRLVRMLPFRARASPLAPSTVAWNGADNTGRRLPAGVYLCRFTDASGAVATRVLVRTP